MIMGIFFGRRKSLRLSNYPLHIAIIEDKPEIVKKLAIDKELAYQKDELGLTPYLLAKYLNRQECLKYLTPLPPVVFKVEKDGQFLQCSRSEFEELMGIEYIDTLIFRDISILRSIVECCCRGVRKKIIDSQQEWFGILYEKEINSGYMPDVVVKWINPILGYGLFAHQDIPPNSYVGEYVGKFRKMKRYLDSKNGYCFEYLIGTKTTSYTIDAQEMGNLVRFINHSSTGNLTPMPVYCNGIVHIILRSNRAIAAGEEITYDYGPKYWSRRENPI